MSREQLLELAGELDRLLTAGARSATGSDALRRRARVVEELATRVPALAKLKDVIDKVLTAPASAAPVALLDLLAMSRQIRANLGDPGVAGELGTFPARDGCSTPLSTKRAHELYDTFTGGGSGKYATLEEAIKEKEVVDLRLQRVLVDALDDKDGQFAEEVSKNVLPQMGPAVLGDLVEGLDIPEGDVGDARRLLSICRIDRKLGAELARKALKEGSVKMAVQALELLPEVVTPEEAEKAGLEYSKDKRATVRAAALKALRTSTSDEALAVVLEKTEDKSADVVEAAHEVLGSMQHPKTTDRLMEAVRHLLDNLTVVPRQTKAKKKPAGKKPAAKGKKATPAPKTLTAEEISALERKRWEEINRGRLLLYALSNRPDLRRADVAEFVLPLVEHKEHYINDPAQRILLGVGTAVPAAIPALKKVIERTTGWALAQIVEMLEKLPEEDRDELMPSLLKAVSKGYVPYHVGQNLFALLRKHAARDATPYLDFVTKHLSGKEQWLWNLALAELKEMAPAQAASLLPLAVDGYLKFANSYYAPSFEELTVLVRRDDPTGKTTVPRVVEAMGTAKKADAKLTLLRLLADLGPLAADARPEVEKLARDRNKEVKEQVQKTLEALAR